MPYSFCNVIWSSLGPGCSRHCSAAYQDLTALIWLLVLTLVLTCGFLWYQRKCWEFNLTLMCLIYTLLVEWEWHVIQLNKETPVGKEVGIVVLKWNSVFLAEWPLACFQVQGSGSWPIAVVLVVGSVLQLEDSILVPEQHLSLNFCQTSSWQWLWR